MNDLTPTLPAFLAHVRDYICNLSPSECELLKEKLTPETINPDFDNIQVIASFENLGFTIENIRNEVDHVIREKHSITDDHIKHDLVRVITDPIVAMESGVLSNNKNDGRFRLTKCDKNLIYFFIGSCKFTSGYDDLGRRIISINLYLTKIMWNNDTKTLSRLGSGDIVQF